MGKIPAERVEARLKVVEWPVDPNFEAESTMLTCGKLEIEK
jgi:hypothetical protein